MPANITRLNNDLFTDGTQPLSITENTSNMIKQYSFSVLSVGTPVWTPSSQKSINLTAVQASAPLGVTIVLSKGTGQNFLALRVTDTFTAVNQYFPSAYRLQRGQAISVRTSDEQRAEINSGAASAAQEAFNGRSDFTNVSNATGLPNGQYATMNSALLVNDSGRIVLSYTTTQPASGLQIESVTIRFYCRLSLVLSVSNISSMIYYWRPNSSAGWTQLQQENLSLTGTIDHLTIPLSLDITSSVLADPNPWNVLQNMQTSFVGSLAAVGVLNTIVLDAVVVNIKMVGQNGITLFGFET